MLTIAPIGSIYTYENHENWSLHAAIQRIFPQKKNFVYVISCLPQYIILLTF